MRKVVTNSQVAHLWASQSQDEARSNNGQFYFVGRTIYSYGSHFPVASFIANGTDRAVLFNDGHYSHSTARHQSLARGAVYGLNIPTFDVPRAVLTNLPRINAQLIVESLTVAAHEMAQKASRARANKPFYTDRAREALEKVEEACRFFGVPIPPDIASGDLTRAVDRLIEQSREQAQAEFEKRKAAAKIQTANDAKQMAAWVAGTDHVVAPFNWPMDDTRLRMKGADTVQTSRGAEVPLADALKLYRMATQAKEGGVDYTAKIGERGGSVRVGAFELRSIDQDGNVQVGCHTLRWAEMDRLYQTLEVKNATA